VDISSPRWRGVYPNGNWQLATQGSLQGSLRPGNHQSGFVGDDYRLHAISDRQLREDV